MLQANCYGCHQPAKADGEYQMTSRQALLRGGESGSPAVVPGNPDKSHLLELITPHNGKAEMPQGNPPLTAGEIEVLSPLDRRRGRRRYPRATGRCSMPTSACVRPAAGDRVAGFFAQRELLAVAGFHEVLLWKADGSQRLARLVGMAERIEIGAVFARRHGCWWWAAIPAGWARCKCGTWPSNCWSFGSLSTRCTAAPGRPTAS